MILGVQMTLLQTKCFNNGCFECGCVVYLSVRLMANTSNIEPYKIVVSVNNSNEDILKEQSVLVVKEHTTKVLGLPDPNVLSI